MHWTFISGVERGQKDPRLNTIARVARALGVSADVLLRRDESATGATPRREPR